jgi:HTH-type transcriptional regulator/antitoxin HigA
MLPYIGTRSKVSEILNGKRQLTLGMMRSLNINLGIPAEVLLKEPGANFPGEMQHLEWNRFPVVEMAKRCWIPKIDDLRENAEELMRGFIAKAGGPKMVPAACFRTERSARYNLKMDPYALMAWCVRVLILARSNPLKNQYVKGSIKLTTMQQIARLSYFENGPLLAREYLEKHGIHMIVVPHLPKTYLDGAAMLMPDGTPVIGLTLRHDRIDNFWFCLLHELSHVARHLSTPGRIIIDDLDLRGLDPEAEDEIEKEADEMTQDALIPNNAWNLDPIQGEVTISKVRSLAEKFEIHPAIIAGRVRFERKNYRLLSRYIGSEQVRKHFPERCSTAAA